MVHDDLAGRAIPVRRPTRRHHAANAGGGERELRHRQRAQLVVAEIGDAGRYRGRAHADQARQAGHQVRAAGVGSLLDGPMDVADDVIAITSFSNARYNDIHKIIYYCCIIL